MNELSWESLTSHFRRNDKVYEVTKSRLDSAPVQSDKDVSLKGARKDVHSCPGTNPVRFFASVQILMRSRLGFCVFHCLIFFVFFSCLRIVMAVVFRADSTGGDYLRCFLA